VHACASADVERLVPSGGVVKLGLVSASIVPYDDPASTHAASTRRGPAACSISILADDATPTLRVRLPAAPSPPANGEPVLTSDARRFSPERS